MIFDVDTTVNSYASDSITVASTRRRKREMKNCNTFADINTDITRATSVLPRKVHRLVPLMLLCLVSASTTFTFTTTDARTSTFLVSAYTTVPSTMRVTPLKSTASIIPSSTQHWATKSTHETTWSRGSSASFGGASTSTSTAAMNSKHHSSDARFGVRMRVRHVLEKAKLRTGLDNCNSASNGNYQAGSSNGVGSANTAGYSNFALSPTAAKAMATGSFAIDPEVFSRSESNNYYMASTSSTTSTNNNDYNGSYSNGYSTPLYNDGNVKDLLVAQAPSKAGSNGYKVNGVNGSASKATVASTATVPISPRKNGFEQNTNNDNVGKKNGQSQPSSDSQQFVPSTEFINGYTAKVNNGNNSNNSNNNCKTVVEPLPFVLPQLTAAQKQALANGERIQEQSKMGREGSGYVVFDVKAPPYLVWECLLDFEAYPENIGTVRSMRMFTNTHLHSSYIAEKPVLPGTGRETRHYGQASITRASFVLSKFQLKIAAVHQYQPHPNGDYMVFTLDKACTNMVLQDAKGIWHTESNPDGRGEEYTRIWLLCEVSVSSILPTFITDYAAKRAMPRATTWLKPLVEKRAREWLQAPATKATN